MSCNQRRVPLRLSTAALLILAATGPVARAEDKAPAKPFDATAYSVKGETAAGTRARKGVVAADPKVLPPGSQVEVKDAGGHSGTYSVEDKGPAIRGHEIDIYEPNRKRAKQFGRKKVQVKVLKRGDGKRK